MEQQGQHGGAALLAPNTWCASTCLAVLASSVASVSPIQGCGSFGGMDMLCPLCWALREAFVTFSSHHPGSRTDPCVMLLALVLVSAGA